MKIPFLDLNRCEKSLHGDIKTSIERVISRGQYILGPELSEFEEQFAQYVGVKYAIGVASGTDALKLALMASGIKEGDEVITATNTCGPTICAIMECRAVPILADVRNDTFGLDTASIKKCITKKTKAIVPVHLYGHVVDMEPLMTVADQHGLVVIEDCAQAHGARYKNKMAGSLGVAGAFSFYPTKNLGALGDAGMITTNNKRIAQKCRLLRNYGQKNRYKHLLLGFNSRLDELQAAVLKIKLKNLDTWNERRRDIAHLYNTGINNPNIRLPIEASYAFHIWHLYVIQSSSRRALMDKLKKYGIETLIHYPIPMHQQIFYKDTFDKKVNLPVATELAKSILSLPLYPEMTKSEINYIIDIVNHL